MYLSRQGGQRLDNSDYFLCTYYSKMSPDGPFQYFALNSTVGSLPMEQGGSGFVFTAPSPAGYVSNELYDVVAVPGFPAFTFSLPPSCKVPKAARAFDGLFSTKGRALNDVKLAAAVHEKDLLARAMEAHSGLTQQQKAQFSASEVAKLVAEVAREAGAQAYDLVGRAL